ncbi:hypothetical protein J6590_053888 [Homalodisca vitripennis]|nr:hypothetical protein J6590_053888 [Homalodisca vitripennis]
MSQTYRKIEEVRVLFYKGSDIRKIRNYGEREIDIVGLEGNSRGNSLFPDLKEYAKPQMILGSGMSRTRGSDSASHVEDSMRMRMAEVD